MAVERTVETVYILDTLKEEAKLIKRANTPSRSTVPYLTNVDEVVRPAFRWDNTSRLLMLRRPALALWPVGIGKSATSPHTSLERRNSMKTIWKGLVDATTPENGQDRALMLLDDLHRMLVSNPGRDRPSGLGNNNPYGVGTEEEAGLPITFDYEEDQNGNLVCMFDAIVNVELRAPY